MAARTQTAALAGVVAALLAAPAIAQDRERPWLDPGAVDIDEERESASLFWERAIHPHRQLYESRVKRAETYVQKGDDQSLTEAEALLRGAIQLAPDDPRAYWSLGIVAYERERWKECAELRATVARLDPDYEPTRAVGARGGTRGGTTNLDLGLGQCLALSGDYEGALRRYKHMLSKDDFRAASSHEVRWRMGEAYMALGRVKEAIAALKEARRLNRNEHAVGYALAAAYDRNEQAAATREILLELRLRDAGFTSLTRAGLHVTPREDKVYYQALAESLVLPARGTVHRRANSVDQRTMALARFRAYLAQHGDGPWARRARHHIDALSREPLTTASLMQHGNAQVDEAKAVAAIEAADAALQACVERTPRVVYRVDITLLVKAPARARARRPAPPRGGGGSAGPASGVRALPAVFADAEKDEATEAAANAAAACLDTVVAGLALPAPTGPDGDSVTLELRVVSQRPQ